MTSRARSSAGEHYLDMVGVTGSIPVVPTTLRLRLRVAQPQDHRGEACPAQLEQRRLTEASGFSSLERPDATRRWCTMSKASKKKASKKTFKRGDYVSWNS